MQWLIVAMGVLLMLVGAISVISGAPIIQIERGWAEVIAGSVAVSGGVVTFAIGILLYQLQVWQHALAAGPRVVVPSEAPLAAPRAIPAPRLADAADAPVAAVRETPPPEPADAPVEPAEHPNLWKNIPEAIPAPVMPTTIAASGLAEAADDDAEPETFERPAPGLRATIAPDAEPFPDDDTGSPARRLTFPPSERTQAPDVGRRPSTLSRDWMSRPLLRSRLSQPAAQEPPPLFAGPSGDLDEDRAPAIRSPRRSEESDGDTQAAPPIAAEPAEPPAPEVSVVGRYQAGSSTYTMYSNGSIDVETEGGDTHHFTSMDELKAFIARQESAVS